MSTTTRFAVRSAHHRACEVTATCAVLSLLVVNTPRGDWNSCGLVGHYAGAESLMLTVAGGLHLDGNVSRAHADKVELEGPSLSLASFNTSQFRVIADQFLLELCECM